MSLIKAWLERSETFIKTLACVKASFGGSKALENILHRKISHQN